MNNNYIKVTHKVLVNPEAWRESGKRYKHICEFLFFDDTEFSVPDLFRQINKVDMSDNPQVSIWKLVIGLPYPAILNPAEES